MRALVQIFYHVPVIGWLTKDAVKGSPEARYFFGFNLLMTLVGLVYVFGYPLVITLALIGAGAGVSGLVLLTAGDAFDRRASQVSVATPAPPRRERPNLARAA